MKKKIEINALVTKSNTSKFLGYRKIYTFKTLLEKDQGWKINALNFHLKK